MEGKKLMITSKGEKILKLYPGYNKYLVAKDMQVVNVPSKSHFRKISILTIINSLVLITLIIFINYKPVIPSTSLEQVFEADIAPDYALHTAGAQIYDEPDAETYTGGETLKLFVFDIYTWSQAKYLGPETILKPWKSPGECWSVKGSYAAVRIKLSHTIIPTHVTLEHISRNVSPLNNISSAPRTFSIYSVNKYLKDYLGTFEYSNDGTTVQTFQLKPKFGAYPTQIIEFQLLANHGHPLYTCIYKIRVHGKLIN